MKDLISKFLEYLPAYLLALGRLLTTPKSFLNAIDYESEAGFRNAIFCFAVTTAIVVILVVIVLPIETDIWVLAAALFLYVFLVVAAAAVCLKLSWRAVGDRRGFRYFTMVTLYMVTLYMVSGTTAISSVFSLLVIGALKAYDRGARTETVKSLLESESMLDLSFNLNNAGVPLWMVNLLSLLTIVVPLVWVLAAWGTIRQTGGFGRMASTGALTIFGILSLPVMLMQMLLQLALLE